ncbi:MAG TPA: ACP S-malonyltransferase [Thermoleophilaceae bacterium]
MRALVEERRPDLLELATDALGTDPFERLSESTANLQVAVFCASLAHLEGAAGVEPAAYAGHSLGELSALAAAGSLAAEDGVAVVAERGRLTELAAAQQPAGAMLAVGLDAEAAVELARPFGLTLANDNSPEQVVLSGDAEAVMRARAEAKSRGLKASKLPIGGAFHSSWMEPAVAPFREVLARVRFAAPRAPVYSCVTAAPFGDADDTRRLLAASLTSGVRWREVLLALHERGIRRFVEAGPGEVLTKLVPRTLPGADARPLHALEAVGG